jgi:hypothetical protein
LSLDGGAELATNIAVDRYLIGVSTAAGNERARVGKKIQKDLAIRRKTDKTAKITARVETSEGIVEHAFDDLTFGANDQLWMLLRYPYGGKGSPEGIQTLLQLAAVELPGSPPAIKPADFQTYCDKWLGLDCNGLVGNFLRHVYQSIDWWDITTSKGVDPNTDIQVIWNAFGGTERTAAAQVDFHDLNLLVMIDETTGKIKPGGPGKPPGHIMISQPREVEYDTGLKSALGVPDDQEVPGLIVLESTAAKDVADKKNGVAKSVYAYADKAKAKGVFRVRRGLNNGKLSVRIKGAKWSG